MLSSSERLLYFPHKIDIHELVDIITLLLNAYDQYTAGHSYRVAYWAERLSRSFERREIEHRMIHIAAHLHDIGKLAVPHEILNKPGRLTDEEFEVVKQHPVEGADILKEISTLKRISDIVLYHHERYDGRGYPHGLKGDEIPFDSRIITVVDAFDAMVSRRPYRNVLSEKEALAEISAGAGRQFDPLIARKFVAMFN